MKTEAEIRTGYNLAWLRSLRVVEKNHRYIYVGKALTGEQMAFKHQLTTPICSDPLADWDWSKPAPIAASSWAMCEADGLVEVGYVGDREDGWAIWLTKRGRELL